MKKIASLLRTTIVTVIVLAALVFVMPAAAFAVDESGSLDISVGNDVFEESVNNEQVFQNDSDSQDKNTGDVLPDTDEQQSDNDIEQELPDVDNNDNNTSQSDETLSGDGESDSDGSDDEGSEEDVPPAEDGSDNDSSDEDVPPAEDGSDNDTPDEDVPPAEDGSDNGAQDEDVPPAEDGSDNDSSDEDVPPAEDGSDKDIPHVGSGGNNHHKEVPSTDDKSDNDGNLEDEDIPWDIFPPFEENGEFDGDFTIEILPDNEFDDSDDDILEDYVPEDDEDDIVEDENEEDETVDVPDESGSEDSEDNEAVPDDNIADDADKSESDSNDNDDHTEIPDDDFDDAFNVFDEDMLPDSSESEDPVQDNNDTEADDTEIADDNKDDQTDDTDSKTDDTYEKDEIPTISVTLPSSIYIMVNPYNLKVATPYGEFTDSIVSPEYTITNGSNCDIRIIAEVMALPSEDVMFSPTALTGDELSKSMFMYLETSYDTGKYESGYIGSDNQLVFTSNAASKTMLTLADGSDDETKGYFKIHGQVASNALWSKDDLINVYLTFSIEPIKNNEIIGDTYSDAIDSDIPDEKTDSDLIDADISDDTANDGGHGASDSDISDNSADCHDDGINSDVSDNSMSDVTDHIQEEEPVVFENNEWAELAAA